MLITIKRVVKKLFLNKAQVTGKSHMVDSMEASGSVQFHAMTFKRCFTGDEGRF